MDQRFDAITALARAEAKFMDMVQANLEVHGRRLARECCGFGRTKAISLHRSNELNIVLDTLPPDLMSAPFLPENSRLLMAFDRGWRKRMVIQVQSLAALGLDFQLSGFGHGIPTDRLTQRVADVQETYPAGVYYLVFFIPFSLGPDVPLPGGPHNGKCRILFVFPGTCRGWYDCRSSSKISEAEMDCFVRARVQEQMYACFTHLVKGFRARMTGIRCPAVLLPLDALPFPCRDPELIQRTSRHFFPSGLTMIHSPDGKLKGIRLENPEEIDLE